MLHQKERPSTRASTSVPKLSSIRTTSRGLPGHFGSALAHRHAHVGQPQRGRIVDAVARHGHRMPAAAAAPATIQQLVQRGGPGHGGGLEKPPAQLSRAAVRSTAAAVTTSIRPGVNRPASRAMARAVAGWSPVNIRTRTPGFLTALHRLADPGAERIVNADIAQGRQPLGIARVAFGRPPGHQQHAQPAFGQLRRPGQQGRPARVVERLIRTGQPYPGAAGNEPLRRSLSGAASPSTRVAWKDRAESKGNLGLPRLAQEVVQSHALGGLDNCKVRRTQGRGTYHPFQRARQPPGKGLPGAAVVSSCAEVVRKRPGPGHFLVRRRQQDQRQLALGQGAGFIGAGDIDPTQGLDARQPPNQGLLTGQALRNGGLARAGQQGQAIGNRRSGLRRPPG